ncbi:uncharacterized mitochondrial protein AtMg00860-like [Glycine max]|uniref:uncharacterized mitochondrial protein AtMg00860-like n=1 Tax=Glycine max TaxID=3847 RepID=UPI0003DE7F9C|nr:uncharacterized mitochondrial protein AtMg00860-like [Glycine max]|eukprot:XP_006582482.1 uncharacterized protein LOC102659714 [Glycine max]
MVHEMLDQGYHQILVQPEERHKTAFRTHHGHYECFTWPEHLTHLENVLRVLQQHVLFVKLSKCSLRVLEIEYLGHIVFGQGVSMDSSKVQAICEWPPPTNVTQLRGFLGLIGYYRCFIKAYAKIAAPLTLLFKKDGYLWTEETETAFLRLK